VCIETPPQLYHNTPAANLEGILSRGLLTGHSAGSCTTNGDGAGRFIHVSLWSGGEEAIPERLTHHDPALLGQEWAKLRIDSTRIPGRLYCDPCSQLGAILEVEHVPAEAIEVVRRWVPAAPSPYRFAQHAAKVKIGDVVHAKQ
jgi:hypothetical protein